MIFSPDSIHISSNNMFVSKREGEVIWESKGCRRNPRDANKITFRLTAVKRKRAFPYVLPTPIPISVCNDLKRFLLSNARVPCWDRGNSIDLSVLSDPNEGNRPDSDWATVHYSPLVSAPPLYHHACIQALPLGKCLPFPSRRKLVWASFHHLCSARFPFPGSHSFSAYPPLK